MLPFDNLSDDPQQEYFSDGLAEDLITDISNISGVFVTARNSSFAFKGQTIDVKEVAAKLGVKHILEGSVRKMGSKLRINAQLSNAHAAQIDIANRLGAIGVGLLLDQAKKITRAQKPGDLAPSVGQQLIQPYISARQVVYVFGRITLSKDHLPRRVAAVADDLFEQAYVFEIDGRAHGAVTNVTPLTDVCVETTACVSGLSLAHYLLFLSPEMETVLDKIVIRDDLA